MLDFLTRKPQLSAGRFGQLSLTKQVGAVIDFTWLCINSGDGDGTAFIQVHEPATGAVWLGAALTIPAKASVQLNLLQTIQEPVGLRSLIAEMREGIFSNRIIASESVALSVVSFPVLTPVGLPVVNGIPGELLPAGPIVVPRGSAIPIAWPCENSGGSSGEAGLQSQSGAGISGLSVNGSIATIPAHSSQTLLLALDTSSPQMQVGVAYGVTLIMKAFTTADRIRGTSLGQFQFSIGVL